MNNFKIPKIRFMNFNDKWKYKILGEISSSIEYGLNASAKDFDGIHKYLRITDIDDSSRLFLTDKLSSPDVNFTEENYENYKLQKNDLLFARTGASVGKTYLYRESDGEVYYAGFLIRARLHDSYDGNFVFQQTLTDKYKQFTEITSQRSGQPGINGKEYGNWKIGMTSYSEQSAIGSLFRTLDDLLASYKDNLANYQSLKATMLSKMFPEAGQTVPEIRLDGFEGEWEEKYIGELADIVRGASPRPIQDPKWFDTNSEIGWLRISDVTSQNGRIYSLEQKISKLGQEKTRVLTEPHLLLSIAATVGKPVVNYVKTGVHDGFLIFMNPKFDREFMFQWLEMFREKWNRYGQPGSQVNLNSDIVKNQKILVPCMEEQQAIGAYFSNLDNLINSYQEKISQLETLKKKLLQDMFI
ncbi:restriction endonuclease subunit S [Streptococcus thermophilus]|uniref:restriction endonuclease subunit S n=1 Tax=Streptococcus thermophilus TaxID=1308 RepID=UPI0022EAE566|nr:restriction endonuclease subunit S [Streptococcus thermophilus]MDA3766039.1 restriction endonuclease subunit S [Streptococcus thermophilus]MDA3773602.1 restriction endonuclease subunit S [Streptococcus thermophilus]